MSEASTLIQLLSAGRDDAVAISAPSTPDLFYCGLREQISATVKALRSVGLTPQDRVAIVLPNGPEMAVAFLAVASAVASAPLNPGYRAEEFEFYLTDLQAKALIVEADSTSPAIEVAARLGTPILTCTRRPRRAPGASPWRPTGFRSETARRRVR